jgi:hypothetical protein
VSGPPSGSGKDLAVQHADASLRELWGNPNPFPASGLPAELPVLITLGWFVVLLGVFVPLAVRRYRSISR